jgi:hypothetical protein
MYSGLVGEPVCSKWLELGRSSATSRDSNCSVGVLVDRWIEDFNTEVEPESLANLSWH